MKKITILTLGLLAIVLTGCATTGAQVPVKEVSCPACDCPDLAVSFVKELADAYNKRLSKKAGRINEFLQAEPAIADGSTLRVGIKTNNLRLDEKISIAMNMMQINSCDEWFIVVPGVKIAWSIDGEEIVEFDCDK